MLSRDQALARDAQDPLAHCRDEFVITDQELIYLDGNSLGRLTKRGADAVERATQREWGDHLVRSWHDWIGLPEQIGDDLAPLLGAGPGEVLVCDQTSVNLFKLASAVLTERGRKVVVADDSNFPSDRYVLAAVAKAAGGTMREMAVDPLAGPTVADLAKVLDASVGLVSLSLVSFKSGAIADLAAITALAHRHGALVLWDLSHAAGAIEFDLRGAGADLAIGCTYKYLNGGPGAPAFLFVRRELQNQLLSPIPGWFGHEDMFAFAGEYRPAAGIRRFSVGTPPILSLRAAQAGIAVTARVGMAPIRRKSVALTELLIARADAVLQPLGFTVATPRDAERRGSHVSLAHPEAYAITQAMIARKVVPDFRAPNLIRLGVAPLYTRFSEIWDAVEVIAEIARTRAHEPWLRAARTRVT